jgi:hypothetical protein
MFPSNAIKEAYSAGMRNFGENYVQEALRKMEELKGLDITWHFVGHLQSNKAKFIPGRFSMVQSIDSLDTLRIIERRTPEGLQIPFLVQVNIGNEESKYGLAQERAVGFLKEVISYRFDKVKLKGLMTIPPEPETPEDSRPFFRKLRELRDRALDEGIPPQFLEELSMGMTDDFEVAVEEGATILRIGRAIFGERKEG